MEEPDMSNRLPEVPVGELRARVDPESFPFENTQSLGAPTERILGQERASDAIKFGMGMKVDNYHIFIAGPSKTGLTYTARTYLEEQAKKEPTPPDWCYVFNFKEPDNPQYLKISAGKGKELKKDVKVLIDTLQTKVPEVFDSDDYRERKEGMKSGVENQRRKMIDELTQQAMDEGFILQVSQAGMVLIPASKKDQPMTQEELANLNSEEKQRLRERSDAFQRKMKDTVKKIRNEEAEVKKQRDQLTREVALYVVGQHLEPYLEKYKEEAEVIEYLKAVQKNIVENIDDFTQKEESQQPPIPQFGALSRESAFRKYDINVLVDNSETNGAPVIIESNPIYPNLFGTIERQALFGALFTDFTMIKPGVLHKANGGYLVMKALDLLKWILSWEALKRALRDRKIRIEDLGELYGIFSTRTIRPEPIPLDVKIVLTGDPYLFELLHIYDDRFPKLFKVKAHMNDRMERKEETIIQLAQMIGRYCTEKKIRHMDRTGVARILEYSMERTEDRDKLTLELVDISDLIEEANYFAGLDQNEFIQGKHVEQAVQKRIFRSNLLEERVRELVEKDIFLIETDGNKIGQINGLSVLMTGDYEFGRPNRITATISVGRQGVVAIERESKMSGNIHTKGVMILTSFLRERFAHNKPLSLTATLCFEQSYGMVEGDSASSTELFALLSALAQTPIYQGIAVTGSVSQKGQIQAVGGVTRKVEAFYDICKFKGLNGRQGVVIPEKNIRNLMLKHEVIDRVKAGQFHIWPINTVEEGIEILTGMEAGELQPDGSYPEGTLFRKVDSRFLDMAELVKRFGKAEDTGQTEDKKEE
jgi:lon-related putative ATP-dependent protease